MITQKLVHLSAALALCLSTAAAFASGSDAAGGAETGDAHAYNLGKSVFATKLACSNCPMAGRKLDQVMAKELLAGNKQASLSADEAQALGVYLKRRFKL